MLLGNLLLKVAYQLNILGSELLTSPSGVGVQVLVWNKELNKTSKKTVTKFIRESKTSRGKTGCAERAWAE